VKYLLDTNIVSELSKLRPNSGVIRWAANARFHAISAVSVDEVHYGLAWKPNSRVEAFMDAYFQQHRILDVNFDIALRAGGMRGRFAQRGIVRDQPDMLIAATAQAHGLTLVTRNSKDFEGCGISLLNPFDNP